ncbi:hypothetical protein KVP10_08595 [Candidimonas humi]|uniref:NlpC/P60 family protein n=1 Tax=Candidimonas humi TaxID=683355 RepID=A0ABV8NXU2_9BURK|nr:hypothetical protein [Candidimonas humi]MBV6304945.1 hypothetical protein [Candidimonas humi]
MHWSDRYVGHPYVAEMADCAVLAERVAHEVFGKVIGLPAGHAEGYIEQAKQIAELKDDYATRIDTPVDGCPALLIGRGQNCHIGVMCWLANEWWVLHANQAYGMVTRERLRTLTRLHFKVEGYYRWK